jgi:hypothetical protein
MATALSPSISTRGSPAKWQRPPAIAASCSGGFHQGADRVAAARALAAAEVHLAVSDERFAIIAIGPGIGGRRMTGDEVKDCQLVFEHAHAALERFAHLSPP